MKNDDYRSEFEEHRKEIKLEEEQDQTTIRSRTELHRKNRKPKKKNRLTMVNIIFALFILIPILILVMFYMNWDAATNNPLKAAESTQVKYETSGKKSEENVEKDEKSDQVNQLEDDKKVQSPKDDEEKLKEKDDSKPTNDSSKAEEKQEKKPEEKAEEKKPEEKKEEKKAEEEKKPDTRTHIVTAKETLYSISVIYYQSGDGVDKIKQANGLTSNEIYVGQSLIIP